MTECRVIVELRHSVGRQDLAAAVRAGESDYQLESQLVPSVDGLQWDMSFPPVELPATVDLGPPTGPRDTGPRTSFDLEPTNATYLVRGTIDEEDLDSVVDAANANQAVVGVFADVAIEPCLICPGDPPKGTDADVERLLCVPALRDNGMDGTGVLVAVVDSGINMAYLNAQGKNPNFDSARSWVPTAGLVPGELPVGHGTMVAFDVCIAAGNCTLLDIALLQSRRSGSTIMEGFLSDAVLAYRHLLDIMNSPRLPGENRSMVVNNSWGMFHPSWDFPVGHPGNYSDNPDHPFNLIVGALDAAGADILFAAGNCGPDCPDGRCQGVTANAIYGANSHPRVLSVAGVDVEKQRVGYSSVGPGRLEDKKPDLSGYTHFKGSGVSAADGGTSAATPVVAGVVAAIRTQQPYKPGVPETSPAAMRNMLTKSAEDLGPVGYDYEHGWGVVNGCKPGGGDGGKDCRCKCRCKCCCCCCCCGDGGGGCGGGDDKLPDLLPVPDANGSYCRRQDNTLFVRICNQGNGPAGPSTTTVEFGPHGTVDIPTPALAPGACTVVQAQIPAGCFDPDCEFRIIADSAGVITESDETNNTVVDRCIG